MAGFFSLVLAGGVGAEITGIQTPPAGTNGNVQFNKKNSFGADSTFSYSTTTKNLSVSTVTLGFGIVWPNGSIQTSPSSGGTGSSIFVQDGGLSIVTSSTLNFTGSQFIITDSAGKALIAIDPSFASGSRIYPATATPTFPYGLTATTATFSGLVQGSAASSLLFTSGTISGYFTAGAAGRSTSPNGYTIQIRAPMEITDGQLLAFDNTGMTNSVTLKNFNDQLRLNGALVVTSSITAIDVTITGLTASKPVKTDSTRKLVSALIDMTTDITSTVPVANLPLTVVYANSTQTISAVKVFTASQSFTGGLFASSVTVTGLSSGNCVQVGTGGILTGSGSPCGSGGSGGSSSLEVFNNNDGTRSSPTASIGLSNAFRGTVSGSTYTFRLNFSSVPSRSDVILNQNSLQSGTTFFVSSGTVNGQLSVSTIKFPGTISFLDQNNNSFLDLGAGAGGLFTGTPAGFGATVTISGFLALANELRVGISASDPGTAGYFLTSGGPFSTLSWTAPSGGGTPGGSDTQVQFNDSGSLGGDAGLTFDKVTSSLTVHGAIGAFGKLDIYDPIVTLGPWLRFDPTLNGFSSLDMGSNDGSQVFFRALNGNSGTDKVIWEQFSTSGNTPNYQLQVSTDMLVANPTPVTRLQFYGDGRGAILDHKGTEVFTVYQSSIGALQTLQAPKGVRASTLTITGLTSQPCVGTDSSGNVIAGTCTGGSSASTSSDSVRVYNSTGPVIPTLVTYTLNFDNERWDYNGDHSNVSNNTRLTATNTGRYFIHGSVLLSTPAMTSPSFELLINYNGSTAIARTKNLAYVVGTANSDVEMEISTVWDMNVNDYVELRLRNGGQSQITITTAAAHSPEFGMTFFGSGGSSGSSGSSALEVFSNFDGAHSTPTASIGLGDALKLSVSGSTAVITVDFSSVTAQGNAFNGANQLLQADSSGLIANADIDTSSVTKQGNVFNGASQLLQANASAFIPNANIDPSSVTKKGMGVAVLVDTQTFSGQNTFISTGTSPAIKITANGTYGTTNGTSGGLLLDCTGGGPASGMCAQVYSNAGAQTALDALLYVRADNTAWNEPILFLGNASSAAQSTLRIDSGWPTMTMNDTTQSLGSAKKFQWSVHGGTFRLEGRNAADNAFDSRVVISSDTSPGIVYVGSNYGAAVSSMDVAGNMSIGGSVAGVTVAPQNGLLVQGSILNQALSANQIVQTDASKNLISAAVSLSSQVTGSLPAASIAAGSLGTSVIASSEAARSVTREQLSFSSISFTASYKAAICQGPNVSLGFSGFSASTPTAACVTGTNSVFGVAQFVDTSTMSVQDHFQLPSDWVGAIDANIVWRSTQTAGNAVWQIQTACVADAEVADPSWNTASTVTDATKGTTNQFNTASLTAITTTGCSAGEEFFFKFYRDPSNASDTLAATSDLISVLFTIRRTF